MPIPTAPCVPMSEIQTAWALAQKLHHPGAVVEFAQQFVSSRGLASASADFVVEALPGWVEACLIAMGLVYERPTHPGLNEREFGLLLLEEMFCRFIERCGSDGAACADVIAMRSERPTPPAGQEWRQEPLAVIDGYPAWLWLLADVLAAQGPSARIIGASGKLKLHRFEHRALPHISWSKWLLLTDKELAASGVLKSRIPDLRVQATGHDRPMRLKWARSIGMWGRVAGTKEIATSTGATLAQVKSYKAKDETTRPGGKGPLQARDANGWRSQLLLATLVGRSNLDDACSELGILRIEARLYREMSERLDLRASYHPFYEQNPDESDLPTVHLKEIVQSAGLRVALPPERWGTLGSDEED